ncbi:Isochorismatase [Candidatus Syntrophocurvum alkaliphilum]|uniref:Isochorismatase n=1 Tax=Candidatus Syntrophocurvum alkaliphilum TaxID=2293317 RepID=A0A6I6DEM2_9FIRM|nr:isochorismatase family protein [Candidatus Syntrophocurvum alkaliphilum]QGT99597.1 Isochorismatase [Candidatus Syntrophocurvum alkaliphilum]
MSKFKFQKEDAVLLVIDLQEKLMKAMKDKEKVYKNTNLLVGTAEKFQIPIIITEQYPKGLGPTVEEINQDIDCTYIEKMTFTALIEEMKNKLAELGKKTILVTGSETHICVFQTVRDLLEDDYKVFVVKDAVCSRFDENYENGLDLMKEAGAVITNAETIVFDILEKSGTPEFKAISSLLK